MARFVRRRRASRRPAPSLARDGGTRFRSTSWVSRRGARASTASVEHLTKPRQVRNAISYVLNNRRHHREDLGGPFRGQLDPYASGLEFDGWRLERPFVAPEGYVPLGTVRPQRHLLAIGWRRYPLIDPREVPGERFDPLAVNA